MYSVHLKSDSLTKDFFLLDFIFFTGLRWTKYLTQQRVQQRNTVLKECYLKILVNCKFLLLAFDKATLNYAQRAS